MTCAVHCTCLVIESVPCADARPPSHANDVCCLSRSCMIHTITLQPTPISRSPNYSNGYPRPLANHLRLRLPLPTTTLTPLVLGAYDSAAVTSRDTPAEAPNNQPPTCTAPQAAAPDRECYLPFCLVIVTPCLSAFCLLCLSISLLCHAVICRRLPLSTPLSSLPYLYPNPRNRAISLCVSARFPHERVTTMVQGPRGMCV